MTIKSLLAFAVAASVLVPAPAMSAPDASAPDSGKTAKKRAAFTVKKPIWKGYGFLPGYPKTERERRLQRYERLRSEPRFYTYYGYGYGRGFGGRYGYGGRYLGGGFYSGGYVSGPHYGFGQPGYVNGRWNGGSIGPCYTQTPIGFIWNCGM